MQLTQFSDYSLRTALYLMANRDRLVSVEEVSRAYGISRHHLVKVVQRLVELKVIEAMRGRNGGMRLLQKPEEINIGRLIRMTEPNFFLVECFDDATNRCPINKVCGLKDILMEAKLAFLKVLDQHTLAEFVPHAERLIEAWEVKLRPPISLPTLAS